MPRNRGLDEMNYELYVDHEKTDIILIGQNKTGAYKMLSEQWRLYYPDVPEPKRYRCKLVYLERCMWG